MRTLLALLVAVASCRAPDSGHAPEATRAQPATTDTATATPEPDASDCEQQAAAIEADVESARACTTASDCREMPLGGCFDVCGPQPLNATRVPRTLAQRIAAHGARCGLHCGKPQCIDRKAYRVVCETSRCTLRRTDR